MINRQAIHAKLEEMNGNTDLACFKETKEERPVEVALCGNGVHCTYRIFVNHVYI
jgi:hypothetical protein